MTEIAVSARDAALCRTGFYQLRKLHPVDPALTCEAAKTLVFTPLFRVVLTATTRQVPSAGNCDVGEISAL